MFRMMRRGEKSVDVAEAEELLRSQDYGIVSVLGDNGYPYGVPVNYVYDGGKIYFHSTSAESHKLDAIRKHEKVSFTIVADSQVVPEKLETRYTSVIVFGRARVLASREESREAMRLLLTRLAPDKAKDTEKLYKAQEEKVVMVEISTEHISGKIGR